MLHFHQATNLNLQIQKNAMQIVVKASPKQKASLLALNLASNLTIHWLSDLVPIPSATAYFDLCFEEEGFSFYNVTEAPIFVSAVLMASDQVPDNAIRINAWDGFLNNSTWEIAGKTDAQNKKAIAVLERMGIKGVIVPDEPGLIAARVIAMIINEAYFALGEAVSAKAEIDIAMKLGTNYPLGPFEWANKIGLQKIASLLQILSLKDDRYSAAPALLAELQSKATE